MVSREKNVNKELTDPKPNNIFYPSTDFLQTINRKVTASQKSHINLRGNRTLHNKTYI